MSSGFPGGFLFLGSGKGRTVLAEAVGFVLNVRHVSFRCPVLDKANHPPAAKVEGPLDRTVKPGKWVEKLYINSGSANPLVWQLNSGKLGCGMAAVFRIKKDKANYTLIRLPCGK